MRFILITIVALIFPVSTAALTEEEQAAELAPPRSSCTDIVMTNVGGTYNGKDLCEDIRGTYGHDTIFGDDGDGNNEGDYIDCGLGIDFCHGRDGNDLVKGGSGGDKLTGGPGRDVIGADDGYGDTVDCGTGEDYIYMDTAAVEGTIERCEHKIVNGKVIS